MFYVYSLKILQRADQFDDLFIADICKLQVQCPKHSFCDTTYIGNSSPPGSYQCVCDDGYSSSSKRPGNLLPQEKNAPKIPLQVSLLVRFVESCLICNVHYISMYFLLLCASSLAGFSRYRNPNPSKNIIGELPLKSFFQKNRFEIAMHLSLLTYS